MTGSSPAPQRAKVVALALATTLLAGGTFATAAVASSSADHGKGASQSVTTEAGKWPRNVTAGKKW